MNKFMKKIMSKKDGFTLVELIVVIAILAILAGVAVPAYSGYINNANKAADTTQLGAIKTAAMAACATEGSVNTITVTTNSTTGAVTKVVVNYGTGSGTNVEVTSATDDTTTKVDDNWRAFFTDALPTLKSNEFKGGALWSSSGTNAGEWVKNP